MQNHVASTTVLDSFAKKVNCGLQNWPIFLSQDLKQNFIQSFALVSKAILHGIFSVQNNPIPARHWFSAFLETFRSLCVFYLNQYLKFSYITKSQIDINSINFDSFDHIKKMRYQRKKQAKMFFLWAKIIRNWHQSCLGVNCRLLFSQCWDLIFISVSSGYKIEFLLLSICVNYANLKFLHIASEEIIRHFIILRHIYKIWEHNLPFEWCVF